MQEKWHKRANEGSASFCPQKARGPQSNMKRTPKYDDFQFGSEPTSACKQGLDVKQENARKGKKMAYP